MKCKPRRFLFSVLGYFKVSKELTDVDKQQIKHNLDVLSIIKAYRCGSKSDVVVVESSINLIDLLGHIRSIHMLLDKGHKLS